MIGGLCCGKFLNIQNRDYNDIANKLHSVLGIRGR